MSQYELARDLLLQYFPSQKISPQPISDWSGPFQLHADLIAYYSLFGPHNVTIKGYGDDYFLPRLADLWDFQTGYRWNGINREILPDWKDDWLVIADEGADPFIFARSTGTILHDYHGGGKWEPIELFPTIEAMLTCLLILGSIRVGAGKDFVDDAFFIKEAFQLEAATRLSIVLQSYQDAKTVLTRLGWI